MNPEIYITKPFNQYQKQMLNVYDLDCTVRLMVVFDANEGWDDSYVGFIVRGDRFKKSNGLSSRKYRLLDSAYRSFINHGIDSDWSELNEMIGMEEMKITRIWSCDFTLYDFYEARNKKVKKKKKKIHKNPFDLSLQPEGYFDKRLIANRITKDIERTNLRVKPRTPKSVSGSNVEKTKKSQSPMEIENKQLRDQITILKNMVSGVEQEKNLLYASIFSEKYVSSQMLDRKILEKEILGLALGISNFERRKWRFEYQDLFLKEARSIRDESTIGTLKRANKLKTKLQSIRLMDPNDIGNCTLDEYREYEYFKFLQDGYLDSEVKIDYNNLKPSLVSMINLIGSEYYTKRRSTQQLETCFLTHPYDAVRYFDQPVVYVMICCANLEIFIGETDHFFDGISKHFESNWAENPLLRFTIQMYGIDSFLIFPIQQLNDIYGLKDQSGNNIEKTFLNSWIKQLDPWLN